MKTRDEVLNRAQQLYDWFLEVRKEFPNNKLTLTGDNAHSRQVYFVGTITDGEAWQLDTFKSVPIFQCSLSAYSTTEHTIRMGVAGDYYLEFRLPFNTSGGGSDDWLKLTEQQVKQQVRESFNYCNKYFMQNEI